MSDNSDNKVVAGPWYRRLGVVVSAAAVMATLVVGSSQASAPGRHDSAPAIADLVADVMPAAAPAPTFDQQMVVLVNQARQSAGVGALTPAKGLTQLALWWSSQENGGANSYTLAHNPNAWTMLTGYGASNRTTWGENVAWSSSTGTTAQQIFTAYMNSPGHRANILSRNYHFIGMGTVSGAHGLFNTTEFTDAVQAGQAIVTPAPAPIVVRKPAPVAGKPGPTRAWAASELRTGDFIRDASTNIFYEMVGGAPVAFVNWAPFGGGKAVKAVRHGVFLSLPRYPRDGSYLRSGRTGNVFVIAGGAPVFASAQFRLPKGVQVTTVDPNVISKAGQPGVWSHLRALPVDGTFVRTASNGMFYRIAGGAPILVDSFAPFGGVKPFIDIDPNAVAHAGLSGVWSHLELVPVDNTYLQGTGSTRIYRVLRGHAYPVRSWASVGGPKPFTVVSMSAIRKAGLGGPYNHLR